MKSGKDLFERDLEPLEEGGGEFGRAGIDLDEPESVFGERIDLHGL